MLEERLDRRPAFPLQRQNQGASARPVQQLRLLRQQLHHIEVPLTNRLMKQRATIHRLVQIRALLDEVAGNRLTLSREMAAGDLDM